MSTRVLVAGQAGPLPAPWGRGVGPLLRWAWWRACFAVTGGVTRVGRLPRGGCVVVANHSSHADAPALLAGLGPAARPRVAAAADYWFAPAGRPGRSVLRLVRSTACRLLVGGFAVRRSGGGSADLAGAAALLRAGRVVVVFPEGTRSRDGGLGAFHRGVFRLAASAGVPVVPVGLVGTARLLPPSGTLRPGRVEVRVGAALPPDVAPEVARATVARLVGAPAPATPTGFRPVPTDSALRRRAAALATGPGGVALVAGWAAAEALAWPLLPEVALVALVAAAPRAVLRLPLAAGAGSVGGGCLALLLAAGGVAVPAPLTTPRMHAVAAEQVAETGAAAVRHQPLSGVPYKVYAGAAGRAGVPLPAFAAESAVARGGRMVVVGVLTAAAATALSRWRRWYAPALAVGAAGAAAGLAAVVRAWS